MCSNKKCPHNHLFGGRRRNNLPNGCEIFAGVSCLKCRDFRP